MLRSVATKALWLAKGAAIFWGAVVTLALVLGVGTVALAAVPGDPFELGETNTISNALTKLAGSRDGGAMLTVDNNSSASGSRALDLRVEDGRAPLNVNAVAGKATNLNSDELDGKGADEIGINGVEVVTEEGDRNSNSSKFVFADCPEGKVVVGIGYVLNGFAIGSAPNLQTSVVIDEASIRGDDQVLVSAVEEEPYANDWWITAQAICADGGTP
jgi:hypothetical protein